MAPRAAPRYACPMSPEELVRRFAAIMSSGPLDDLREVLCDDVADRDPIFFQPPGREGVAFKLRLYRDAYPHAQSQIEEIFILSEGIQAHWRTQSEPGGPIRRFLGTFIIKDNKIAAFSVRPESEAP